MGGTSRDGVEAGIGDCLFDEVVSCSVGEDWCFKSRKKISRVPFQ